MSNPEEAPTLQTGESMRAMGNLEAYCGCSLAGHKFPRFAQQVLNFRPLWIRVVIMSESVQTLPVSVLLMWELGEDCHGAAGRYLMCLWFSLQLVNLRRGCSIQPLSGLCFGNCPVFLQGC